MNIGINF